MLEGLDPPGRLSRTVRGFSSFETFEANGSRVMGSSSPPYKRFEFVTNDVAPIRFDYGFGTEPQSWNLGGSSKVGTQFT